MRELEIVWHRQIPGLNLFVNRLDYRTVHVHPEWELIWVLENVLTVTCGAETRRLEPGQAVLFAPNEPHGLQKQEGSCTFLCMQISPRILPLNDRLRLRNRFVLEEQPCQEKEAYIQRLKALGIRYFERAPLYELDCLGKSMELLHGLLKWAGTWELSQEEWSNLEKSNSRIRRLLQYVEENYSQKISLGDFAREEGCSVSYLSHFIRESLNQTFREYVMSVRFERACQLISQGKDRMLDVCNEAGFSDYRYFVRAFRRQFSVTPEEYAKNLHSVPVRYSGRPQNRHSMERICTAQESLVILRSI
jgi:AraC-like DNA-binding protein